MILPLSFAGVENNQPTFQSKKTLYTDFDGTYFPFVREDINSDNKNAFAKMYLPFDEFQKQSDGDCSIVVTSGRSKNDFFHTVKRIMQEKLPFSVPKGLISSNGANEFKISDVNADPICTYPNDDIKADRKLDEILEHIKTQNPKIEFVEVKINGDEKTYQDYSSQSVLDKLPPHKREKYIAIARDGKYNAELVVSKKLNFYEIKDAIGDYISQNNLPYSIEAYENAKYTAGFEYDGEKTEQVSANTIFLKYTPNSIQPDKYDFIRKKIQEIINNSSNDIVIVAGDGFNDEKMLNPLNYLDLVYDGKTSITQEQLLNSPDMLNALKTLPIRSIICGSDDALDNLRVFANKLNAQGIDIIACAPNPKEDYINLVQYYTQQATLAEITSLLGKENPTEKDNEKIKLELQKLYDLSQGAKQEFIKQYCEATGFPNMGEISSRINEDVIKALNIAQEKSNSKVLFAGCNPTCSISNGHALPGSDLDTLFICLRDEDDKEKFKKEFKEALNPILVGATYNRTNDMPDVVSIGEIVDSVNLANKIFEQNNLFQNEVQYRENLDEIIEDWIKAGQYNLDVNQYVPDDEKTPLLRAGLLLEILRDGNVFANKLDRKTQEFFENSCVYKFSNMQQMRSYKYAPLKNKHKNRELMLADFNNKSTDEQLDIIVNVIRMFNKSTKNDVNNEIYGCLYQDAGCGNMEELMQPLLSEKHRIK